MQRYVAASTSVDSISRVLVPVRQPSQVELIDVDEVSPQAEVEDSPYSLYHVSAGTAAPICVTVKVNGANLRMEVDTGASLSLISDAIKPHIATCGNPTHHNYSQQRRS